MKKILIATFALAVMLGACKKEDVTKVMPKEVLASEKTQTTSNLSGARTVNTSFGSINFSKRWLVMSLETYTNAVEGASNTELENLTKETTFVSMNKFLQASQEESILKDTYNEVEVAHLLNAEGVIQIGEWIIRVDKANEKVFVLNQTQESQYNDLLSGNTSNVNLKVYSTDDDVLSSLEEGSSSSERGIFCGARRANGKRTARTDYPYNNARKLQYKVEYLSVGIYFQLKSDVEFRNGSIIRTPASLGIEYNFKYEGRCNRGPSATANFSLAECGVKFCTQNNSGAYTIKHYRGSKALKKYFLGANFKLDYDSYKIYYTPTVTISDGY